MRRGWAVFGRGGSLFLVVVAVMVVVSTGSAGARPSAVSWSGIWSIVDHGTAGRAAGNDYTWTMTLAQSGSALKSVKASPETYSVHGTATGSAASFTVNGCCNYVAKFTVTLSADGKTFKGSWTDSQGNAGTAVGTRTGGAPSGSISGRVVESVCGESSCSEKGVAGVSVTAAGKDRGSATTGADGRFSIEVGAGDYVVRPSLAGREFVPEASSVSVTEGGSVSVTFSTCAPDRKPQALGQAQAAFCRLFGARGLTTAESKIFSAKDQALAVKLVYKGVGWDPKGGPITVTVDGRLAKRWPQTDTFLGTIVSEAWPQRGGKTGCTATLVASQAGASRSITVSSKGVALVIFSDLDATLRPGDPVCPGELFLLEQTRGTVVVADPGSGLRVLRLYQKGRKLGGDLQTAGGLCLQLVPASRGYVRITENDNGWSYKRQIAPCS